MRKQLWIISLMVLAGAILVFAGCKEKEEPMATTSPQQEQMGQAGEDLQETAEDTVAAAVEQKLCPVMGNPIDKEVFVEYKGQKVYFCCSGCEEKFNADPEKYLSKLPQFEK